jgi:hypothetical protein
MKRLKTAKEMCTRYRRCEPPLEPAPAHLQPLREPPENRDFDAAAEWLAHVQAGRIQVR